MKSCSLCRQSKPNTEFNKSKRTQDGLHNWCKSCRNARRRQQYAQNEQIRLSDRKRKVTQVYGVEYESYETLCQKADYRCMICHEQKQSRLEASTKADALHVDFDTTGGRRVGVLCYRCHTLVLHSSDDPSGLESAVEYLKKNRRKNKVHYKLSVNSDAK